MTTLFNLDRARDYLSAIRLPVEALFTVTDYRLAAAALADRFDLTDAETIALLDAFIREDAA